MRLLCALLLFSLLAAGPGAAATISPGSVATTAVQHGIITVKPAITTPTPILPTQTPFIIQVPSTVVIDSVPQGAMVTIDGLDWGTSWLRTPNTWFLSPEPHTLVLTLDGYQNQTTIVTPAPNKITYVNVTLVPAMITGKLRQNTAAIAPAMPAGVVNVANLTAPVTTTRGMTQCPPDQKCMTLAEAEAAFQTGWEPAGTGPCDRVLNANDEVIGLKYCIVGTLKPTLQPGIMQSIAVILPATLIPVTGQTVAPSDDLLPVGGTRQTGMIESAVGFISGIFSGFFSTCSAGYTKCPGGCVDIMTDMQNCGRCFHPCHPMGSCVSGQCTCPANWTPCISNVGSEACGPLITGLQYCNNQCAARCFAPGFCSGPNCLCSINGTTFPTCQGKCTDLYNDPQHCGNCQFKCNEPAACSGGHCILPNGTPLW